MQMENGKEHLFQTKTRIVDSDRKGEFVMKDRKTWAEPIIEEVCLSETEYGGEPSKEFDQQWFDKDGALVVNFVS